MRLSRLLALLVCALLPLPAGAQAAVEAGEPLSLSQAIGLALEKNEAIVISRESLLASEADVDGAHGAYDPVLELDANYSHVTEPVNSTFSGAPSGVKAPTLESTEGGASLRRLLGTGGELELRTSAERRTSDSTFAAFTPSYFTQVGVELSQPLWRGRKIDQARLNLRVAARDREGAAAALEREITGTVADVEQAYWTLVALRREIAVREEAVRLADEQLTETSIRVEQGAAPETEVAQPRAELERRRGALFATRESLSRAENDLKLLILGEADEQLWVGHLTPTDDVEIEPQTVDVAGAIERALVSRPELKAADAVIEQRRVEAAYAADQVRPALDAVVSYDRLGFAGELNSGLTSPGGLPFLEPEGLRGGWSQSYETLGEGDFDDARAGFVFRIPLGNRTAKAGKAGALSRTRQAEAERTRLRKAVRAEVLDAAAALETASQRIEAARAAREASQVQLQSERERYAVGLSTNFLVLTRQNDLSEAWLEEIAALTDYRKARTEMARATATLLAERGIRVEGDDS